MKPTLKNEYDFIKKVYEIGENLRALKMCRQMIDKLSAHPQDSKSELEFRKLRLNILSDILRSDADPTEVINEYNQVFTACLSQGDERGSVDILDDLRIFYQLRDKWSSAFDVSEKIISLFSGSKDAEVQKFVHEAHAFRYQYIPEDDPVFSAVCFNYGLYLAKAYVPADEAAGIILEICEDFENHRMVVKIIEAFLQRRILEDRALKKELLERKTISLFSLGEYQQAIKSIVEILIEFDDDHTFDYLVWCAEAFQKMDRPRAAAIILHGITDTLASDPEDERYVSAIKLLKGFD